MILQSKTTRVVMAVLLVGLCLTPLNPIHAQTFQAQLTGTVQDASGAVMPNAMVTATNIARGTSYVAKSNQAGIYRVPTLPPGQYRLSCSMSGFKKFEEGPVTVAVDQVLEININLEPGLSTQEITVSAAPAQLETGSSTLGQVVTTRSIQGLPLNVRDPFALMALTPGVILGPNFGNGGGQDVGRNYFKADVYIGGGRSGSNFLMIDGAPDTLPDGGKAVIDPPVDSVQEFAVQASSYDAQFGRTSGGVVNMVTKSGSNDYHGTAYDFERHSILDGNNFFNNSAGIPLRSFARHQFGANAGGAIRKNKWFFFGDYEGLRQGYPLSSIDTLPTELQRQGNFSQTYASNGSLITIYDPSTLTVGSDGTRTRSPFPNNTIPASRINPVAAAVTSLYPGANLPGNAVTGQNNYIFSSKSTTNSDKYDIRTDVNFTQNDHMLVRFSREQDQRAQPGNMPLPAGGGRFTTDNYTNAVVDFTHVFSANTVADVNLSGLRALAAQHGASLGFDLSSLKLPASFVSQVPAVFPSYNMTDVTGTSNGGIDSFVQSSPRNVWAVLGSVTHQMGKHSLKFGGSFMGLHFNEGSASNVAGTYTFDRTFTQGPNPIQATSTAGFGYASFLLGTPTSGGITTLQSISTYGPYYSLFAQDDWKLNSKLTLNFGLRWDVSIGNREKYNRLAWFDPSVTSPIANAAGLPNLTGSLQWVGQGNDQNQQETDWANWAPRFGFAYAPNQKTVIRGGYGIYFLPRMVLGTNAGALEAIRTTSFVASIDGLTPTGTISDPFPASNPILPAANDRNPLANLGGSITAPEHGFSNGYAQSWSLDIQRTVPWGIVVDAHYWGNKGTRLMADGGPSANANTIAMNINQLPVQYLSLGSHLNDLVPNPFYGVITSGALAGPTISRQQALLPYPQYTGVAQVYSEAGDSTFEGFTIQAEKRMSEHTTFLVAYTRSKAIDDVRAPLNAYDLSQEKGLSVFDTPNHFQLSLVYSLPFGRDRAIGRRLNRFANAILGDWDLNTIVALQSGLPIQMTTRPLVTNGDSAKLSNPSIAEWFNTSAFSIAAPYTFGNVGPVLSDARLDWTRNVDAVLVKEVNASIGEHKITTQFRWEVFNVLNTPQFGTPNVTVSSQQFGAITSTANSPRNMQLALKVVF